MTQPLARCAFEYSQCLLRDPFALVSCTEHAEDCGLFEPVSDAGAGMSMPSPSTSPTCALKMAECIARNPFRAPQCAAEPCK
ncbi:MAG TPA: hypothetical protein VJV78_10560 [Polyangiales bacterium]|nr:hypothetical protein [Polyangiales bacterium]